MIRTVALAGIAVLLAACSIIPVPPVRIDPPEPECHGISSAEAGREDMCTEMFEAVRARFPSEVATASRVVISDTCEPEVLCDRVFVYDAAAVVVPGDGDIDGALWLHVFGHFGEALRVEPWEWPLPEHIVDLLDQGA